MSQYQLEELAGSLGARITGLDLRNGVSAEIKNLIKKALHDRGVVVISGQELDDDQLTRVSSDLGPFGIDPYIAPIDGYEHIIAVQRKADEKAPIFAENWHTDWSFQETPPAVTMLYGITIPPHGGDTFFADQRGAAQTLPADLRAKLTGKNAVHSAQLPYAPKGVYGEADRATDRSMDIRADDSAYATQLHPILSPHPDTGEECVFGCVGYIVGIDGMEQDEAVALLMELLAHQSNDSLVYQHQWTKGDLVLWDNRRVLHKASGGFEGYDRLLHRTTIQHLA